MEHDMPAPFGWDGDAPFALDAYLRAAPPTPPPAPHPATPCAPLQGTLPSPSDPCTLLLPPAGRPGSPHASWCSELPPLPADALREYLPPPGFDASQYLLPDVPKPEALPVPPLADLSGTTAAKSRNMSDAERELMLLKRRLRNRQSAARSRERHRATVADLTGKVNDLVRRLARANAKVGALRADNERLARALADAGALPR